MQLNSSLASALTDTDSRYFCYYLDTVFHILANPVSYGSLSDTPINR